jgi:capsular polysaccharide biosynthesis protein
MLPRPLRKTLATGLAYGPWSSRLLGPPKRGVRGVEPEMAATLIEPGQPPPPPPEPSPLTPPALLAELHRSCAWEIPPLHVARFRHARYFQPTFAVIDERDRLLHAFSQGWEEGARGKNYAFEQVRLRRPLRVPGRSLLLDVKTHSDNFFHWLIEAVPRFRIAQRAGWNTADFDHVLVSNPGKAFHTETFARFGVASHRILDTAQHPHVECEELVAVTEPAMFAYDAVVSALREAFPATAGTARQTRLFVSRADAEARKIRNEDELFQRLEPLGFTRVSLTGRRVAGQAEIFAAAEIVVAAHGAALANLVFCAPGTTVVELHYPLYTLGLYWRMARKLGLRYVGVQGLALAAEAGKDPRLADMTIDAEACAALVRRALETHSAPP